MFFAIFQPATEYTAIIERSRGDVAILLKKWFALINCIVRSMTFFGATKQKYGVGGSTVVALLNII